MGKVEKILERYKIYLGVKDVKVVVGPYKTRTPSQTCPVLRLPST
jgi:hypothetical protein